MKQRKTPGAKAPRPLCSDTHVDDGVDPRKFFDRRSKSTQSGRRDAMLCARVAETIEQFLVHASEDPVLEHLRLTRVEPAPDASRLRVVLWAPSAFPRDVLQQAWTRVRPLFRREIAHAVNRKRTPDLVVRFTFEEEVE